MSSNRLLQMSGVVIDLIYRVDAVPPVGGEAAAHDCMITPGGGFNAMVAARRAGMDVAYGGAHGTGQFADLVRHELDRFGIPCLQPQSALGDQGSCVVLVDREGERTFVFKEGADGMLDKGQLGPVDLTAFDWILLSGYGLAHAGSRDALRGKLFELPQGSAFVFDPSPAVSLIPPDLLQHALSCARWISANAEEAAVITGLDQPAEAAGALSRGVSDRAAGAVVRCGSTGCWVAACEAEPVLVPGFPVETIDTNGAGDTHVATFIAALSNKADPVEAARYANAAAALSTTRYGPATAPENAETEHFINSWKESAGSSDRMRELVNDG